MRDLHVIHPDNRGRMALRPLVDRSRAYTARRESDGSIVLTPIAHVMSDVAYNDFQADPVGYAEMLERARTIAQSDAAVSVDEFWKLVDNET